MQDVFKYTGQEAKYWFFLSSERRKLDTIGIYRKNDTDIDAVTARKYWAEKETSKAPLWNCVMRDARKPDCLLMMCVNIVPEWEPHPKHKKFKG
jgi:hypothetical protein